MPSNTLRAPIALALAISVFPNLACAQYTGHLLGTTHGTASCIDGNRVGGYVGPYPHGHATVWDKAWYSPLLDLQPAGATRSYIGAIRGGDQGGYTYIGIQHAMLWHGNSNGIDLNPSNQNQSRVYGVDTNIQVGIGGFLDNENSPQKGIVWHGTSKSATDMTPKAYGQSACYAVLGKQIVGMAKDGTGMHAILWHSVSPEDYSILDPVGTTNSTIYFMDGAHQVGWTNYNSSWGYGHAYEWSGTAASAVALNESGYIGSDAYGVSGDRVVGDRVSADLNNHATLWTSTGVTDLEATLPTGYDFQYSAALAVGPDGTVVGYAYSNVLADLVPVEWTPNTVYFDRLVPTSPTVVGGNPLNVTLSINNPAPVGGKVVTLSANGSAIAWVPASVTVPEGTTSTVFQVKTGGVHAPWAAKISATVDTYSSSVYIKALPASLLAAGLVSPRIHAGNATTGRVSLNGLNGYFAQTVSLSSDNPNVAVPATVTIPVGARYSLPFTVQSNAQATGTATITATLSGVTAKTTLTLLP